MRVPLPLVAALLVAPILSGCIDDPDPDASNDPGAGLEYLLPAIPVLDGKAIVSHIETFSEAFPKRNANNGNHKAARDYLEKGMMDAGLEVVRQPFEADPSPASTPSNQIAKDGHLENIIGLKWGRDRSSWIVIGGHYDVTDGAVYGAYDDGSGTIITLELAKAFATMDTFHTIAFTMFDGEEQGLRGSRAFWQSMDEETFDDSLVGKKNETFDYTPTIFAMIDLDMIGINYPAEAPIFFDDNADFLRDTVDATRLAIGIPDDKIKYQGITAGRSDYAPFEDHCVPTGFFISSFEENYLGDIALPAGTVTYPFWHQVDTMQGMELMAGDRDLLEQGFGVAARLSSELLHALATSDGLEVPIREQGLPCEDDI